MEQPPTYQQLLSEQYEENARSLYAIQQEADVYADGGDIEPHNSNVQSIYQLENPDEFQQFGGNRNTEDSIQKPKVFNDTNIGSVSYQKNVQTNVFPVDTVFRSYVVPGIPAPPASLIGNKSYPYQQILSSNTATSSASWFVFGLNKLYQNIIKARLTLFQLPNTFFNVVEVRKNYYIFVKSGTFNNDVEYSSYTKISLPITDSKKNPLMLINTELNSDKSLNGYYYSDTSVTSALSKSLNSVFPDLSCVYENGYCSFQNTSATTTYTFYFNPDLDYLEKPLFHKLAKMLGFRNYVYELGPTTTLNPAPSNCDFPCSQISPCQCYGTLVGEDRINMNADPYIYLAISDWNNMDAIESSGGYYSVFAKIPINNKKGEIIYDTEVTNTTDKEYRFPQPVDIERLEVNLYDKDGYNLLMPDVEWNMVIEADEVLNRDLYEKMREL